MVTPRDAVLRRRILALYMAELSVLGEQVVEELGGRFDAGHEEMVTSARARDVEQVALGGVDLVQFGLIADSLDSCLRRQHLVIAGGDGHGAKLDALGEVHRADCDVARDAARVLRQIDRRMTLPLPTAAMALSSSAFDRTNTPISGGAYPSCPRDFSRSAIAAVSASYDGRT